MGMDVWELSDFSMPWCVHEAAILRVVNRIGAGEQAIRDNADAESLGECCGPWRAKASSLSLCPGVFGLNEPAHHLLDEQVRLGLDPSRPRAWNLLHSAVELTQALRGTRAKTAASARKPCGSSTNRRLVVRYCGGAKVR